MTDEKVVETEEKENTTEDYIAAIKELKAKTVSRDEYEELKKERNTLLANLVNGQVVSTDTEEEEEKTPLSDLRKELFKNKNLTDVEYVEKALELRERVLEDTGEDIFVGKSHANAPTSADYDTAEKVADVLKKCVENSNGNNTRFLAEVQAHTADTFIPKRGK